MMFNGLALQSPNLVIFKGPVYLFNKTNLILRILFLLGFFFVIFYNKLITQLNCEN